MSRKVDKLWEEYREIFSELQCYLNPDSFKLLAWSENTIDCGKQALNDKFVALLREAGEKSYEPLTLKAYQRLRALGIRLIVDLRLHFKEEWGVVEFSEHVTHGSAGDVEATDNVFEVVVPDE